MESLIVTGYASIDYPVRLAGNIVPDQTTHIEYRDPLAWPRIGGTPAYVGTAAVASGIAAAPVTWIGDDDLAGVFSRQCSDRGLCVDGIARLKGERSPVSLMVHQADGATACLFDPGFSGRERLTDAQRTLISAAAHICISVGPSHLVDDILALCSPSAALYWIVKNDPLAFPDDACAALAARASVIFCNQSERHAIDPTLTGPAIVVETRGAQGVEITIGKTRRFMAAQAIAVDDPTGAGDSFAGGFLGAFCQGSAPLEAARQGMETAAAMLESRIKRTSETQ